MITLYAKDATDFTTNGLGVLDGGIATVPEVEEAFNGAYTLTLRYVSWGRYRDLIDYDCIIKAPTPDGDQRFRIYKITKQIGFVEIVANHIFYDLAGNFIEDANLVDQNGGDALNHIGTSLQSPTNFTFKSNIEATASARLVRLNAVQALLDTSQDNSFVNRWGGELLRDNDQVIFNAVRGSNRGFSVKYGKNLTSYEATIDTTTVVTRIMPYGYDGLMIPEKYVDSDLIDKYPFVHVKKIEYSEIKAIDPDSNSNDDAAVPLEDAYALLRAAAQNEYTTNHVDQPQANFKVSFQNLQKTREYAEFEALETLLPWDYVSVDADGLPIDARMISYRYDPLNQRYIEVELGNYVSEYTDTVAGKVDSLSSSLMKVSEQASHAAVSANGKNTNYYGTATPPNPVDGDLWYKQNGDTTELWQYDGKSVPPGWKLRVSDLTGQEISDKVDNALKEFDAVKQAADKAVEQANIAVTQSVLSQESAKAAADAVQAAQAIAQEVSASLDAAQAQAANAAGDAAEALKEAQDALAAANGQSAQVKTLQQIVDDTTGTISTLAKQVDVDTVTQQVKTTQTLAQQTANGLLLKSDQSVVDTLSGAVKQQSIELTAAQDKLALTLTASDLTKGLSGYATQTWAQNQITATAKGWEAQLSTVQAQYNDFTSSGANLLLDAGFESGTIGQASQYWSGGAVVAGNGDITNGVDTSSKCLQIIGQPGRNVDITYRDMITVDQKDYKISIKTRWNSNPQGGTIIIYAFEYDATKALIAPRRIITQTGGHNWTVLSAVYTPLANARYVRWDVTYNGATEKWPIFVDDWWFGVDYATSTEVADLKLTVSGFSATFAKQTALQTVSTKLDTTASGLNLVTAVTGTKGEKVTQVIADVNSIKTTMTGANGYTTRLQTLEGFQSTASSSIKNIQSQQTLMADQWTSIVGDLGNMVRGGDFEDQSLNQPSPYWGTSGTLVVTNGDRSSAVNTSATCLQITGLASGNRDVFFNDYFKVAQGKTYKGTFKVRWANVNQNGAAILYAIEYDANKTRVKAVSIVNDTAGGTSGHNWKQFSGTYTPSTNCAYIRLDVTYNGALGTSPIWVDDIDFREDLASNSQITQLQDAINLRVTKDGIISQINMTAGKTLIQNNNIYLDASTVTMGGTAFINAANIKSVNASTITVGKLDASLIDVVGLNAKSITTGTITGENLSINLATGEVTFAKGAIKSTNGRLNIDVNDGTFVQSDGTKGMMFANGNLYLSSSSWWDEVSNATAPKPDYGFIGYGDTLLSVRGFEIVGRDALTIGLTDNKISGIMGMQYTASPVITMDRSQVTMDFSGLPTVIRGGQAFTIVTNPYYNVATTPGIEIGVGVDSSDTTKNRVFINGSYVHVPSAYSRTTAGSANMIVDLNGTLFRTSSATKYKSNIMRFSSTEMALALLELQEAHWYNKGDLKRYSENPGKYPSPKLDYGMIAEDLASKGLEDLVVRGDDGQLEDIRYDRIAPALLPLIKEMKLEIDNLKEELKS